MNKRNALGVSNVMVACLNLTALYARGGGVALAVVLLAALSLMPLSRPLAQNAEAVLASTAAPLKITLHPATPTDLAHEMDAALASGRADGIKLRYTAALKEFYTQNGFPLLWVSGSGGASGDAAAALGALEVAWTHGLNPLNYNVERIRALIGEGEGVNRSDLELLLSDAIVQYSRDLTGMRVKPASVGQSAHYWQPPMAADDVLAWMLKNKGNAKSALDKLSPQGGFYKKLREELVRTLAEPEALGRPAVRIDGNLRPGASHAAVPVVRAYLKAGDAPPEGANYYDDRLARRVMAFQEEHGIAPDGIIGPATQKILNLSRMDKINQLIANLERQRWMDRVKPDKYVMVNIPSATLWAVEKGHAAMQMKVIVGKETRPTNSFKTTITGVRLNPNWTVPPTIKREDYLPALAQDPEYLAKRGIDIRYEGKSIDPLTVDWASLPWDQAKNLTMVQGPGAGNPLGRVRVLMPNNYNIYLHDTNDRSVFRRNSRGLSSGCIRVEQPEELANFILRENEGWSTAEMQRIFESGKMRDIRAERTIPVYLVYNTIWEKSGGKLVYGIDLYGQDDQLVGAIRAINGFEAPQNIAEMVDSRGFRTKSGLDYTPSNG